MADLTTSISTTLPPEEVLVRAVQFFTNDRWRVQSQTNRIATFVGAPKVFTFFRALVFLILLGCFVIPGVIYYAMVFRSARRLQNLVVTTTPDEGGCTVIVSYPKHAQRMIDNFAAALPKRVAAAAGGR
jgi:hypothetical protein